MGLDVLFKSNLCSALWDFDASRRLTLLMCSFILINEVYVEK